jgi:hypothetical protein
VVPSLRSPHWSPVCISPLPYVLHILPISVFLTWSPELYLVRSTEHKAPCYATEQKTGNRIVDTNSALVCSVGVGTRLRAGQPRERGSIPSRKKSLYVLQIMHTAFGVHPASYVTDKKSLPKGKAGRCVTLTILLHLVPKLRLREAIQSCLHMIFQHGGHEDGSYLSQCHTRYRMGL